MPNQFITRRKLFKKKIRQNKLDGFLVLLPANRFYLSGFELHDPQCNESAGCLIITANQDDWLCTDSRYAEAAKKLWPEEHVHIYQGNKQESIARLVQGLKIKTLGVEQEFISYAFFQCLNNNIPQLVPHKGLVEELRIVKDDNEIQTIKKSCALNHEVLRQIQPLLKQGITEKELAWEIERHFREAGARELAFTTIIAVGKHAALPHYLPGDTALTAEELVLIDLGCRVDNYCSDQTRTFWVGNTPHQEFKKYYQLVKKAQEIAISAIRPGMQICDLYRIVVDFFSRHAVDEHFTHGLGHGIGLETHELPAINAKNSTSLLPGMIITIEPGLYFPRWGGVRLEKMVLVTETGGEVL